MALTAEQRWIAAKIDTRMQKLIRTGKDNMAIMAAMADHMPAFHQLLNTTQPDDFDQLTRKFPGFYRYAKILESLATGIQSGAIPVPGRKEAPQQTEPATGYRQLAAAMDLRVRQLADEGVPRSTIIERMTGYIADLSTIWNSTTNEQLATLCHEYPGFHTYAMLMEEAAEAERQKPARPYDGLPELPDALKEQLSSLLGTATKLERDYQSVLDAAGTAAPASWLLPLSRLHAQWQADLTRFRAAIQDAGVPQKSRDMVLPALERLAQQIGKLEARVQAS
jgi:phosphoglycolate phosphatase-like HAD superfamily hydrolase